MKKNLLPLLFAVLVLGSLPAPLGAAIAGPTNFISSQEAAPAFFPGVDKAALEKHLDRKLNFREKLTLHFAKKKISKQFSKYKNLVQKAGGSGERTGKSQIVAFLLCLFFGGLGIHRFYLGYTGMGILYLLTFGFCGIGWLIDLILLIIPNGLTPKGETSY